jgi:myo-inositol-1(or 4)-monophosphatase
VSELEVALEAAAAAAAILQTSRPGAVTHKGAIDLVTAVDLACEHAIREILARRTPGIPVLGEEGGGAKGGTRWVVDPLDGTTNFVHGFPCYAVSIALEVDGRRQVGVVHDPTRPEIFAAERGKGATCNGRPIHVSECTDLGSALVGTGFPYDRRERSALYLARFEAFMIRTHGIRRCGSAALDLANVAAGRLDAFWEFNLRAWDVAAGALLIEEAGGRISSHAGGDLERDPVSPLASNGRLHQQMVEVLSAVQVRAPR